MWVAMKTVRFFCGLSCAGAIACGQSLLGGSQSASSGFISLEVHTVQPAKGVAGDVVVLTGQGFGDEAEVFFDDRSGTREWLNPEALLVTVPNAPGPGPVDVIVVEGGQSSRLVEGFLYEDVEMSDGTTTDTAAGGNITGTDDPTGDTGGLETTTGPTMDTGSDPTRPTGTGDTGRGLPSGVVQLQHLQVSCPSCLGLTSDLQVSADAAFHDTVAGGWMDWLPPVGTCEVNPLSDPLVEAYVDVGEWVTLTSGVATLRLDRTWEASGPVYGVTGLDTGDFLRTAFFDLTVADGGEFGSWSVVDAVLTPTGFTDIQPWELLLVSPLDAFSARLSKSGTTLTWAPEGTGTFLTMVDVYTPAGLPTGDLVVCQGADSGEMMLPGGYFAAHPAGSLLVVYMIRNQQVRTTFDDGAWLDGVAQMGVIGTAVLVP